jgi:hypothetical protein
MDTAAKIPRKAAFANFFVIVGAFFLPNEFKYVFRSPVFVKLTSQYF